MKQHGGYIQITEEHQMATKKQPRSDPVAKRHAKRMQTGEGADAIAHNKDECITELTARLLELISQTVYGSHNPTRMQLLNALDAVERALYYCNPDHNLPNKPSEGWLENVRKLLLPPQR